MTETDLAVIDCYWDLASPSGLAEIYENATVRAAALLNDQPSENLAAIRSAMEMSVRGRFAHVDHWRVPVPAALVTAAAASD